jgi:hypothetical protein
MVTAWSSAERARTVDSGRLGMGRSTVAPAEVIRLVMVGGSDGVE